MPGGLAELNRQDPENIVGIRLPQPYRRVAKIVDGIWEEAWAELERRHPEELLSRNQAEAAKRREAAARIAEPDAHMFEDETIQVMTCFTSDENGTIIVAVTKNCVMSCELDGKNMVKTVLEIPSEWICIAIASNNGVPRRVAIGGEAIVTIIEVWDASNTGGARTAVLGTFSACATALAISDRWCAVSDEYGNTRFHPLPWTNQSTSTMEAIAEEDAIEWQQEYKMQLANISKPAYMLPCASSTEAHKPASEENETFLLKSQEQSHAPSKSNSKKIKAFASASAQKKDDENETKEKRPPPCIHFFICDADRTHFYCSWSFCFLGFTYVLPDIIKADHQEDVPKELARNTMPFLITATTLVKRPRSEIYNIQVDEDLVVTLEPPHPMIALAGSTGLCCIWDLDNQFCMHLLRKHDSPATAIECSSDGRRLISGDAQGIIHLYALGEHRQVAPKIISCLRLGTHTISQLHILGVVNIAFANTTGPVIVLDLERGNIIGRLALNHQTNIVCGHDVIIVMNDEEHVSVYHGHEIIRQLCLDLGLQFPPTALPELIYQLFRYPQLFLNQISLPTKSTPSISSATSKKSLSSTKQQPKNKINSPLTTANVSVHQEKLDSSSFGVDEEYTPRLPLALMYHPRAVVAEAMKDSIENCAQRELEVNEILVRLEQELVASSSSCGNY
uniref:Uncharacterized protein n=1 Tax=Aureoumbra lagunensis TaxID=44058 RepID=A0A7S3JZU1_9STRA|mmetsp:Transcript_13665/g.20378  ORF Transcript_13665/g.20378 Transcript_13665/m.20378 type:complete len:678 (-) Transcript_13665:25-2058(-)